MNIEVQTLVQRIAMHRGADTSEADAELSLLLTEGWKIQTEELILLPPVEDGFVPDASRVIRLEKRSYPAVRKNGLGERTFPKPDYVLREERSDTAPEAEDATPEPAMQDTPRQKTVTVTQVNRTVTNNSGMPRWDCIGKDDEGNPMTVYLIAHETRPEYNSAPKMWGAGYLEMQDMKEGDVMFWNTTPIIIHTQKEGNFWAIVAVEPKDEFAGPDHPADVPGGEKDRERRREAAVLEARRILEKLDATFDVETTGLDPDKHQIVQVGIADKNGKKLLDQLIRPIAPQQLTAKDPKNGKSPSDIHGIMPADLDGKPVFAEVYDAIREHLSDQTVVGWNVSFDMDMLEAECKRANKKMIPVNAIDVMSLYSDFRGEWNPRRQEYRRFSLRDAILNDTGTAMNDTHEALQDAKAVLTVLKAMANTVLPKELEAENETAGSEIPF